MAKKLKVLTPQTTDGNTLAYGEDEKPVYTESIVEVGAKRDFESLNAKLPKHLQHKLEVVEVQTEAETSAKDDEMAAKDAEIETLKKQLEAATKAPEAKAPEAKAPAKSNS